MDPARIAELLHPFLAAPLDSAPAAILSESQLDCISTYIDILVRWNSRINLTAVRDPEQIVTRHFGESLFAARVLLPQGVPMAANPAMSAAESTVSGDRTRELPRTEAREPHGAEANAEINAEANATAEINRGRAALQGREQAPPRDGALAPAVADVGSGAGFPGIPLKLWAPSIRLTLIESNHKKATFLREVARALTLTDVDIQNTRAETLPPASFDLVTLRAVERFGTVLPAAAALVRPAGRLALLIGRHQIELARHSLPRFSLNAPTPLPSSHSRLVLVAHREPS